MTSQEDLEINSIQLNSILKFLFGKAQKFHIPVLLFDCFIPPERSPPISGTAPLRSQVERALTFT